MKQTWLVGILSGALLAGSIAAQAQQKPEPQTQKPEAQKPPAQPPQKPEPQTPAQPAARAPQRQAARADAPAGELALGTITIPRTVSADGKPLARGRYTLRLTAQSAQPTVPGQLPDLNRWVEFVQGGQVKGREVVSIVPADEVATTQPGPDMPGHVGRNGSRVEMLKGGEYLRIWIARGGTHYLLHLPPSGA